MMNLDVGNNNDDDDDLYCYHPYFLSIIMSTNLGSVTDGR